MPVLLRSKLREDIVAEAHHIEQLTGRTGKGKQAGHRHEGTEFSPIGAEGHIPIAQRSVSIRTKVKRIMYVRGQLHGVYKSAALHVAGFVRRWEIPPVSDLFSEISDDWMLFSRQLGQRHPVAVVGIGP
jgi:hypothetical protein